MNQILYEGWIFFPNHRVDMQAGVGLHMSQARQNLGTLGEFKTPLRSKKVFLGPKKRYLSSKISNGGVLFFIISGGTHKQYLGPI